MKKVLIVTYFWPPSGKASVHWPLAIVKHLPKFDWAPIVATVDEDNFSEKDLSLLKEIPKNLIELKSKANDPFNFYKKFIGKNKDDALSASEAISLENKSLRHKLSIWIRMNLFVPDARVGWYFSATKMISKYLKKNKIDAVVTIGPPHSTHLIGNFVTNKFNIPHYPVLIDPWVDIVYYKNFKRSKPTLKIDNYLEEKILDESTKSIFVTKTTETEYHKKYKFLKNKTEVLPWGYNEEDFKKIKLKKKKYSIILHAGNIFDYQNPKYFWKAIALERKKGNDLRLRFIGTVAPEIKKSIENEGLTNCTEYIGFLPFNQIHSEMQNADYLLVCASEPRHVPGKLYEYLRAGKTIIAFGDNNIEVGNMIKSANCGKIFSYNYSKKDIFKIVKKSKPNLQEIKKYSRLNVTKKLSKILNS
ncbi:MAG: glycosyltransferase [Bacteroidetes bacterium]|nr:glycosyltransferase [Bacteroidota bacterium]